ncbi:MAG: RluA family pseudouridine synthase [Chlamydiia bacterium]
MEKFVDRLFAECEQEFTKTKIRSLIDQGYARLNGKIHRIATTVCSKKDRVELLKKPDLGKQAPISKSMPIIFEDPYIRVFDKPTGIESDVKKYPGLVHRLDKETSGLLIEAKTAAAKGAFEKLFKDKLIEKSYLAIVFGNFSKAVRVDLPIARLGRIGGFERFGVQEGGRSAITVFTPLSHIARYTLLECAPQTGRTHQIRVHLKALDYPIVGDLLYSQASTRFERMYLHALAVTFIHPFTKEKIRIECVEPQAFKQLLNPKKDQK